MTSYAFCKFSFANSDSESANSGIPQTRSDMLFTECVMDLLRPVQYYYSGGFAHNLILISFDMCNLNCSLLLSPTTVYSMPSFLDVAHHFVSCRIISSP